jgi:hypothetical protein
MLEALTLKPLLDDAQISALRDALGDEELCAMFSELPRSVHAAIDAMKAALEAEDLPQIRRAAHVLQGLSSSFGATRLSSIAREIELKLTSIATVAQHMPMLIDTIDQTIAALPTATRS